MSCTRARASLLLLALGSTLVACKPASTSGPASSTPGGSGGSEPGTGGSTGTGGKAPVIEKDGAPAVTGPAPDGRALEPDLAPTAGGPEAGVEAPPPLNQPVVIAAAGDIAAAMDGDEATTATLLH